MPLLLVMRHAKSDWDAATLDHDRPLNPRGVRSAAAMGELLAKMGEVPDLAVSSSAVRARTTLEGAIAGGAWPTRTAIDEALYATTVDRALRVASQADDTVERQMIVGHEPTWGALVAQLTGGSVAMRTATIVGIEVGSRGWATLPTDSGTIRFVLQARNFVDGA